MNATAYVLCTTLWHNRSLMHAFGCDSFIRIHDPSEFGARIAKHIPGFVSGGEGPCMYQYARLIETDVDRGSGLALNSPHINESIANALQHYPYFLKHRSFSHQAEYRLLWFSSASNGADYLDIKVPEARELCSLVGAFEYDDRPKR